MTEGKGASRKRAEHRRLIGEIRTLKGEFLLRIPAYREQAASVQRLFRRRNASPQRKGRVRNWTAQQMKGYMALHGRWGPLYAAPENLLSHPLGSPGTISTSVLGLLQLSLDSVLLVVALDLRSDLDAIEQELRKWFQAARQVRRTDRVRPLRYGPEYVHELREALRAWDLWEQGTTEREIAEDLFPGFQKESALKRARGRLKLAREMIEQEKYREILPLESEERRLRREFWTSTGREP